MATATAAEPVKLKAPRSTQTKAFALAGSPRSVAEREKKRRARRQDGIVRLLEILKAIGSDANLVDLLAVYSIRPLVSLF